MKTFLLLPLLLISLVPGAAADTFTVNNILDPGNGTCDAVGCTLREAIDAANANPGADIINFNIPDAGVQTITPGSSLPNITEAVTIDGYTQPGASANTLEIGNDAVLLIELDGTSAGGSGLALFSDGNVIRGLVINRCPGTGIFISGASDNIIEGNFIGTDAAGTADLGNAISGVSNNSGSANLIGGALPAARNVISGNGDAGVLVFSGDASDNMIQGNYIGTDRNGGAALPNDLDGVRLSLSSLANQIGGAAPGEGNLISGNARHGVYITDLGGGSVGGSNTVQGNFIGTDATGTAALGNVENGIFIENRSDNTIGGTVGGAGNVISSNGLANSLTSSNGILIEGDPASGNLVQGNFIGTDISGSIDLGNVTEGVHIFNAPDNIVGGSIVGARNIISGNSLGGVRITSAAATGNLVQGNYIGTDVAGSADLGNAQSGVSLSSAPDNTIGGSIAGAGNLISGNGFGVQVSGITATGNRIQGNLIGTDAAGIAPIGNNNQGVLLGSSSTNTTVGGPAGAGNIIAFNNPGVQVSGATPSTGNSIFGNSIFTNDGLGIDLGGDDVTDNDFPDSDVGANELQNYPTIDSITVSGPDRTVEGELVSNANTDYVLDFYSNSEVDPSGFGEGETWLGFLDVHTNAQGRVNFTFPLEAGSFGQFITATATDPESNTSEFSLASEIVPPISRFLNISTRLRVQTGDNVLIGGFIITGNDPKEVIVRAIGPSLGNFGVADPLANPILELHYPDGTTVVTNNNWRDDQEAEIMATGLAPSDDLESAILVTLDPGAYTAIVRGVNAGTGVALVETYDLSSVGDSALANISTRGLVETRDNVMIGGIILGPETAPSGSILLRGIGPSLGDAGITSPLADPMLELRDGNGALVMANDNWKSSQQSAIEMTGLQPGDDLESAILATLAAGNYTAIMSGVGGTTGIGLVEAYHLE